MIGKAIVTKGARDTLMLVLADVPTNSMSAFIEDYAVRRLGPVIAAKIIAQGGDPKHGDAALVIARSMLEDAALQLRKGGLHTGHG